MPKKGKKKKILSDKDTPRSDPIVPEQFEPPLQPREKVGGIDCYAVGYYIIAHIFSFWLMLNLFIDTCREAISLW